MDYRHITIGVMVVAFLVIAGVGIYDILPARSKPQGDTISEVTLSWWQKRPIVPLMIGLIVGILFGHWGWPQ